MDEEVAAESERSVQPRHSSMRIDFNLSIGYTRQRAGVTDHFEARLSTVGLLVVGSIVTLIILAFLVPRILALFS